MNRISVRTGERERERDLGKPYETALLVEPADGKDLIDGLGTESWHSHWGRYFLAVAGGNLLWEFLHMPLYTLWQTGTWRDIVLAAIHCTGGDILIALSCLAVAIQLVGRSDRLRTNFGAVASVTIALGVAITVFLEWLNVVVRAAWAYSDHMPVLPLFGFEIGVSPLLQWIVIPAAALIYIRCASSRMTTEEPGSDGYRPSTSSLAKAIRGCAWGPRGGKAAE